MSARVFRRDQQGNVVVMSLLGVVVLGLGVGLYMVYDAKEELANKLDSKQRDFDREKKVLEVDNEKLRGLVPWFVGSGQEGLAPPKDGAVPAQAEAVAKFVKGELLAGVKDQTGLAPKSAEDFLRSQGPGYSIQTVLEERKKRIDTLDVESKNQRERLKVLDKSLADLQAEKKDALERKDQELARLGQERNQAREQAAAIAQEKDKEIDALRNEFNQEREFLQTDRNRQENAARDLRYQLEQKEKELANYRRGGEVTVRSRVVEADGIVLQVDQESDIVVVDIGGRHRVREGMSFDVYWRERGGMPNWKGKIQITEVRPLVSTGRIVREPDTIFDGGQMKERVYDPGDPITPKCFIDNPWFTPGREAFFALVGEFRYHTRGELKRLLEEVGNAKVVDKVSEANFIIIGVEPKDDTQRLEYEKQVEDVKLFSSSGGLLMREEDVMRLLRNYKTSDEIGQKQHRK